VLKVVESLEADPVVALESLESPSVLESLSGVESPSVLKTLQAQALALETPKALALGPNHHTRASVMRSRTYHHM
jgi:hypothetical protein